MSYTSSQASVMNMIKAGSIEASDGQRYTLQTVYECINSNDDDQDNVYWMVFFDRAHDDMKYNPFVFEYIEVYDEGVVSYHKVGDLINALQTRSHAHHVLYMKFGSAVVGHYIDTLEDQDGVLGWAQQFRDPQTGSLRRLELIEDMKLFIEAPDDMSDEIYDASEPTIDDVELGDAAADMLDAKADDYEDRMADLADDYAGKRAFIADDYANRMVTLAEETIDGDGE